MYQCLILIIFFANSAISYDRTNLITNKYQNIKLPICNPPCQNRGICRNPGVCDCLPNYFGSYCENTKAACTSKPYLPRNSKASCTRLRCNIACQSGFKFEDGTNFATLECLGGQWKDSKTKQLSLSDCKPTCVPACKNGGRCISLNTCQCLKHFKGPACQYDIKVCNISNTGFNGNIQCSSNNEGAICSLKCPAPSKSDIVIAEQYKCLYSSGEFLPKPIPKCILPPGSSFVSDSKTSYLQYSSKLIGYSQDYMMQSSHQQKYSKPGSMSVSWNQKSADSHHMQTIEQMSLNWNNYQREFWKNTGMYLNWNEAQQELNRLAGCKDMSLESSKLINKEKEKFYEKLMNIATSYTLYTTANTSIVTRVPKAGLCIIWNGNNVKTFDGSIFKHSLACSHTLVEDRIDGSFHIILQKCLKSSTDCYNSLVIYWQSVEYTFENKDGDIVLKTPRKQFQIPIQIMGMQIAYINQFLNINIDAVGILIQWDLKEYISIEASAELWNKTAGLCGTLDSVKENDYLSKDGQIIKNTKEFVDIWKVNTKNYDISCSDENINMYNMKYSANDLTEKWAKIKCNKLLTNHKVLECLNFYNKSIVIAACIREYVNCPSSNGSCVCEFMEMLIKSCIFQGVKLNTGWRDINICPMACKKDRIYQTCGPAVELTCSNNPTGIVSNICNEGCFCPKGKVQYKNKCISIEQCPCTLRNKEFQNGSIIQKDCNSCVCKSGIWKCSNNLCDARCSAIGGLHFETFDGKQYNFIGKCSYYLLKTVNVSIIAENLPSCNSLSVYPNKRAVQSKSSSCLKAIIINTKLDNKLVLIKLQEEHAYINNKEILKYPQILNNGLIIIRQASSTVVKVDIGNYISVLWDGISNTYIDISTKLRNKTHGLCGTFNNNIQDDFLTPEGDTETNVEAFANKWRTSDCINLMSTKLSKSNLHPCQQNPQNKELAENFCNRILNVTFADCHWAVDPEPYYDNCLFDVCSCNTDFATCYCPMLSAYGTECSRQGITTNWRNNIKKCDLKCPKGQVYDECGNSCFRTCNDLSRKSICNEHCVAGCHCPLGEYLNENNECISANNCPCFFNGSNYNTGYKEVRLGKLFLELCNCIDGSWQCSKAELGDEEKYPAAAQLKSTCKNLDFAKFVECAPVEIKTCMNIDTYVPNYDDCKAGCVCMTGYIFDLITQKCIRPENCSCYHGDKPYQYGDEIKDDCNECKCIGGNWKCTKNKCASTCSVWGDSHFTTFDKRDFDFQGACDYILSKGYDNNGNGFTITIQNVVCGSLGVTCSKSVKININGKTNRTLTLSSDIQGIGNIKEMNSDGSLIIYKAGVFIVIEDLYIGIQIKWDHGTRVYLKLQNVWKNKVTGLCGNYNDDAQDDMKSPSFGIETSALSFGHSWKVLDYCTMPSEQIDACKEHPQRLTWAQHQCGILKSEVFQDCHNHVSYESYLKRCIFDTCACDQGGDCECLCTAISAYASACNARGIYIKWRTPHLCPMQCDSLYSHYSPCTTACPLPTCNNILEQHIVNLMCHDEQCLEGCEIKKCEKDLIYKDENYTECIPKHKCKPVCLETIDGNIFYEGDIIRSDKCQTCYCSKKKEVCSGAPCSLVTDSMHISELTSLSPEIEYFTTMKVDKIDVSNKCTLELEYKEFPNDCYKFLHCQPQINGTWTYVEKTCGPSTMFNPKFNICDHIYNVIKIKPNCDPSNIIDMGTEEISIEHPEEYYSNLIKYTTYKPKTTIDIETFAMKCNIADKEYSEFTENCHKFLHCQQQIDGSWSFIEKSCGLNMMFNPIENICDHPANVKKIKPICDKSELGSTRVTVVNTSTEKISILKCNKGYIWSDCAYHCDLSCHFYKHILIQNGHCNHTSNCEEGCIDPHSINCKLSGKLWRDVDSCVTVDECPCMDDNGKMIKPNGISQIIKDGKCQNCQCIDNSIACNDCVHDYNTTYKHIEESEHTTFIPTDLPLIMTTSVTPPTKCRSGNYVPIINGIEKLPDSVFSASSNLSPLFLPHYARLNTKPTNDSNGSWSPLINDQMQYLQVSLPYLQPIFAIIIQGSPIFDQYVTLFKILYSIDGEAFHYLIDKSGKPQIFSGPINGKTAVKSFFTIPIEALVLRIYPLKWHGSISIRFDIFGCDHSITEEKAISQIYSYTDITAMPITITEYENKPICFDDSEIEIGVIEPNYVSASSVWPRIINGKKPALKDMLKKSFSVGWRPALDTPNEFISFDFKEPKNLTGVLTLGGSDGWVTAFNIFYSNDGRIWNKILNSNGLAKIFVGNHDKNTPKTNYFKYPVRAQHLKIVPYKWKNTINMRIEPLGCLEQYPEIKETIKVVDASQICLICPDIENIHTISDNEKCKCIAPYFWDGDKCVEKNECPCIDNHIKYAVGVKFENKECMNCVCVLGGIQQCKAKICPPCKNGLRQVPTKSCLCTCESCPEFQKLCPSSGDCIPERLWCNGVKDCEDDEDEECSETVDAINNNIILNTTKECPELSCPPGMEIMFLQNPKIKLSPMFESKVTKQYVDDEIISVTNKKIQQYENTIPNPDINDEITQENNCLEFVCKPKQTTFFDEKIECNNFKCPENYEIQTNFDEITSNSCPTFTCKRQPKKDDVCYIVGHIFKTFDGTEYKYEVCSHILVRDISHNKWNIKLNRNCSKNDTCTKELKIEDKISKIILKIQHNLKLMLHGYLYDVHQLQKSYLINSAFILSQPGETILIVSKNHGFWVSFNTKNEIKIGVSSKYINTVDGLCGYYNGKQIDDKRLPNGNLADSTLKFGDSWSTNESLPNNCQSWVCPNDIQKNALKLCMSIKNDALLLPCAKMLNFNQFIPTCVEKICECYKSKKKTESTLLKDCKCALLESFVTDCLSVNPDLDLDTWRYTHKCEINCTPPLVYRDCYKKRCEKSCDSNEECPVLPNVCFSGCFCPEGTIKKDNHCVPITECKNCVCKNFGLTNFITYDKQNVTLKNNCNYLVSRDKNHNFQIFGSYECEEPEFELAEANCFNVLHIITPKIVVTLKTYNNGTRKLMVNGREIQTNNSFKNSFISVENFKERFIINMIKPQVEILSRYNDLSFTVSVSNLKYQGQLEGLCGNCDGQLDNNNFVNNTEIFKNVKTNPYLIVHEKKLKLHEMQCENKNTSTKNCILPDKNACLKLLDTDIFGECHNLVEPSIYISTCQQDLCSERTACASISAYTRECNNNGVCVDWRKPDFCPYECPSNLQYNTCGCTKTCTDLVNNNIFDVVNINNNNTVKSKKQMTDCQVLSEGCFCTKNKFLHDNKCVLEKECIKCDGVNHYYGDIWQKDKCTECQCNSHGRVECTKKMCQIEEIICEQGFKKESRNREEDCCPTFVCVPHHPQHSSLTCPKSQFPKCSTGEQIIEKVDINGCSKYICECSPSLGCEEPLECENEFHELILTSESYSCCPVYECGLPPNVCLVEINKKQTIKQLGEKWKSSNPCSHNVCSYGLNGKPIHIQQEEICSNIECDKDSTYIVDDGECCGKCVQTMCEYEGILYNPGDKWLSDDDCTSFLCIEKDNRTIISSSTATCPDISECPENMKILKDCCVVCEIASSPYKNCDGISIPDHETIGLIEIFKKGHGVCKNKKPISGFKECYGNCSSGTKYKKELKGFKSYCDCCSIEKHQSLNITLTCSDGFQTLQQVEVPSLCGCKPCRTML